MQIESVRELKSQFTVPLSPVVFINRPIVAEATEGGGGFRDVNVSAQSLSSVEPVQRTVALGVSQKGKKDYKLAVRVQRQLSHEDEYLSRLHKAARGEVDVRYVGRITKRTVPWYRTRSRPIRPGCSIGHFKITAGTLGCLVLDAEGLLHILSNNHVLANENRAKAGDSIIQAGAVDGGLDPRDRVGSLARFVRLRRETPNLVDCAIASIAKEIKTDATIKGVGAVKGVFPDQVQTGLAVRKLGRTTGLTRGHVTAFELDNVVVNYDIGNLRFDNQIEIEGTRGNPFSDGGDSGSLIVTDEIEAVALLFAGAEHGGPDGLGLTYGNPADTVLKRLHVTLE